jgi:hypothetical protein
MTESGIAQMLERRCAQAGMDKVHPHQFRRTTAHTWLAAGGSEVSAMRNFGWRSRTVLSRYGANVADERARDELTGWHWATGFEELGRTAHKVGHCAWGPSAQSFARPGKNSPGSMSTAPLTNSRRLLGSPGQLEPRRSKALSELDIGLVRRLVYLLTCLFVPRGATKRRLVPVRLGTLWARPEVGGGRSLTVALIDLHCPPTNGEPAWLSIKVPSSVQADAAAARRLHLVFIPSA